MKKSEMVCKNCIKFDGAGCREYPLPLPITMLFMWCAARPEQPKVEPSTHWCAKGVWQNWSNNYNEMEPFYWGDWETNEKGEPL